MFKKPKIGVTKKFTFEAAHKLYSKNLRDWENARYYKACNRLHGHSYKLFVTVNSVIKDDGMIINFTELNKIVEEEVISKLDHQYLNDVVGDSIPLTCENLLLWIRRRLQPKLKDLKELTLYETEKCFATYTF